MLLCKERSIVGEPEGKLSAIVVSGPFGACKEQSSGLYAQTMAERGFLSIAFDPSFTGESGGFPRAMHSPDIDVEDFQAAVDFLSVQENVDPERIGIIGICGWGGMALQTACIDTRIKATVTSTMYDMSRVAGNGYFDSEDNEEARHRMRVEWENNESVSALKELASESPITIQTSLYGGFEQVGSIGHSLPRNDERITAQAGDIVLYSGNQLVVFYGSNTWAYTRLGHITDKTPSELTALLGNDNATITISVNY